MNTRPANMTAATSLADIQNGCRFEWGERDDFIVLAPANQSALLAVLAERPDLYRIDNGALSVDIGRARGWTSARWATAWIF